jgi:hypothetical protein
MTPAWCSGAPLVVFAQRSNVRTPFLARFLRFAVLLLSANLSRRRRAAFRRGAPAAHRKAFPPLSGSVARHRPLGGS